MAKEQRPVWQRASNYRAIYFKHNKGIFYKWYLCAYCRKKFLEKDIVEVDHCIACGAVKDKWYFQVLFGLLGTNVNDNLNLVASCFECNRAKGKKTKGYILRGAVGKMYHLFLQATSQALLKSLVKYWFVYVGIFCLCAFSIARLFMI